MLPLFDEKKLRKLNNGNNLFTQYLDSDIIVRSMGERRENFCYSSQLDMTIK